MKSKFSLLILSSVVFLAVSCGSGQYLIEDDVYSMKSSELPFGENLLDETSYETFKYRTKKDKRADSYYAPENGGVLNRSPRFTPRLSFMVFYGNLSPYAYPMYMGPAYFGHNQFYTSPFYSPFHSPYYNPFAYSVYSPFHYGGGFSYNVTGNTKPNPVYVGPRFVYDGISSRRNGNVSQKTMSPTVFGGSGTSPVYQATSFRKESPIHNNVYRPEKQIKNTRETPNSRPGTFERQGNVQQRPNSTLSRPGSSPTRPSSPNTNRPSPSRSTTPTRSTPAPSRRGGL